MFTHFPSEFTHNAELLSLTLFLFTCLCQVSNVKSKADISFSLRYSWYYYGENDKMTSSSLASSLRRRWDRRVFQTRLSFWNRAGNYRACPFNSISSLKLNEAKLYSANLCEETCRKRLPHSIMYYSTCQLWELWSWIIKVQLGHKSGNMI